MMIEHFDFYCFFILQVLIGHVFYQSVSSNESDVFFMRFDPMKSHIHQIVQNFLMEIRKRIQIIRVFCETSIKISS